MAKATTKTSSVDNDDRAYIPAEVETAVLVKSRRRCCLCFGLHGDDTEKYEGQLAHVNRRRSDSREDNLAWLCTVHHSRRDATSPHHRNYRANEIKHWRAQLYEHLELLDVKIAERSELQKALVARVLELTEQLRATAEKLMR